MLNTIFTVAPIRGPPVEKQSVIQVYVKTFFQIPFHTSLTLGIFFSMALQPLWALAAYFGFLIYLRAVGLLGRVTSSSQGLYLNTRQHKHRKTHTHH
jgi:hypothetical protein